MKLLETDKLVGLEKTGFARKFTSFSKLRTVRLKPEKSLKVMKLINLPKPAARNRSLARFHSTFSS